MSVNELRSPKKLLLVCLAIFALMVYFGKHKPVQPVLIHGTVKAVQEQDGTLRAAAVEADGDRLVVKFTNQSLMKTPPPALQEGQQVDLKVTGFKALRQGVTCDFVELVKAWPAEPAPKGKDSAPQGHASLPVDDLKSPLGFKGM